MTSPRVASPKPIGIAIVPAAITAPAAPSRERQPRATSQRHNHGSATTTGAAATSPDGETLTASAARAVAGIRGPTAWRRRASSASTSTPADSGTMTTSGRSAIPYGSHQARCASSSAQATPGRRPERPSRVTSSVRSSHHVSSPSSSGSRRIHSRPQPGSPIATPRWPQSAMRYCDSTNGFSVVLNM